VFSASCDKTVKMWDLNSNQAIQVAQHDAPVKTVHFIKANNYTCIMTGSWDKTIKVCLLSLRFALSLKLNHFCSSYGT